MLRFGATVATEPSSKHLLHHICGPFDCMLSRLPSLVQRLRMLSSSISHAGSDVAVGHGASFDRDGNAYLCGLCRGKCMFDSHELSTAILGPTDVDLAAGEVTAQRLQHQEGVFVVRLNSTGACDSSPLSVAAPAVALSFLQHAVLAEWSCCLMALL